MHLFFYQNVSLKRAYQNQSRLSIVARFGVGYDTVDVKACTSKDIAVCITPDGVRRPVAASILTLILALSSKLIIKDKITRLGKKVLYTEMIIWEWV